MNNHLVFISYANEDIEYAKNLYQFLSQNGLKPWMDKKDLLPGQNWEVMINSTLRKADFIILLLSSRSLGKRGYVQKEFRIALDYLQEKLDSDVYIIPVKIDSCEVPDKLQKLHWVDYSIDDYLLRILDAINTQKAVYKESMPIKSQIRQKETNPDITTSDNTIQKKSKVRRMLFFTMIFVCLSLVYYGYSYFDQDKTGYENNHLTDADKIPINQKNIYLFLEKYFNSLNDKDVNAHDFFADKIDQYILRTDLTPADINHILKYNTEFIENKSEINKNTIFLFDEKNGVKYWRFWNHYTCYRPSKQKFESCNVLTEFGINGENKITSIKEIKIQNLKYTKNRID